MKKRKVYHVVKSREGWEVKLAGKHRGSATLATKEKAVTYGRKLAKHAELGQLKVHKQNGRIQTEYTYGKDPRRSKG